MQASSSFRSLLRIRNTSVDGTRTLAHGLSMIKGVGRRLAQAVIRVAGFDPSVRTGELSDRDIARIEEIIANPVEHGIPNWMVNRKHDLRTGEDRHITSTELDLVLKMDLDRMKRTRSWKGIRHERGLKVRGQRTRTTGRKGLVVGVFRKKKGQQQQK
ncbi:MAG: 30S ribosomal protein S13 [Promethearchaeota archaeon]